MVIRPKSSATVVVVLFSTPDRSSTPRLASVITSSVLSGVISLIEPTIVVFPAPNPPAMRTLSAAGSSVGPRSESLDAIEYRLKDVPADHRVLDRVRGAGQHVAARDQVSHQHFDHGHRDVEACRDLCH